MTGPIKWRGCYDGAGVGPMGEGRRKSSLCFGQVIQ